MERLFDEMMSDIIASKQLLQEALQATDKDRIQWKCRCLCGLAINGALFLILFSAVVLGIACSTIKWYGLDIIFIDLYTFAPLSRLYTLAKRLNMKCF